MYRVLVPVDTNEDRALTQAEYVASLPDAPNSVEALILFAFHEELGEDLPKDLGSVSASIDRIGSVRRARDYLADHGIAVDLIESSGEPADLIRSEAAKHDVDAVVLGGRKRSPTGKAIFGSVTQSVILNTDIPTVVTGVSRD